MQNLVYEVVVTLGLVLHRVYQELLVQILLKFELLWLEEIMIKSVQVIFVYMSPQLSYRDMYKCVTWRIIKIIFKAERVIARLQIISSWTISEMSPRWAGPTQVSWPWVSDHRGHQGQVVTWIGGENTGLSSSVLATYMKTLTTLSISKSIS